MSACKSASTKEIASQASVLLPAWFARPTCVVAADLVGKVLCRQLTDSDGQHKVLRMRISETEAYIGDADGSVQAHVAKGKEKSEIMYCQGGLLYVYLTYGIHNMLNLITGPADSAESVLIRAGFLSADSDRLVDEQQLSADKQLTHIKQLAGPGKLTKGLQIDRTLYGRTISPDSELWVEEDGCQPPVSLRPRIGIDYAGEAKDWLLRYVWTDHRSLSKK